MGITGLHHNCHSYFVFVVAFSLVCPLFHPVSGISNIVYRYWFWGNFLNEKVFPTISGTILNSSGIYSLQGFFTGRSARTGESLHTPIEALLNKQYCLFVPLSSLYSGYQYIAWQNREGIKKRIMKMIQFIKISFFMKFQDVYPAVRVMDFFRKLSVHSTSWELNTTSGEGLMDNFSGRDMLLEAAETVLTLHMLPLCWQVFWHPDRLQRDFRYNCENCSPVHTVIHGSHLLAKFLGVWSSVLIAGVNMHIDPWNCVDHCDETARHVPVGRDCCQHCDDCASYAFVCIFTGMSHNHALACLSDPVYWLLAMVATYHRKTGTVDKRYASKRKRYVCPLQGFFIPIVHQ
jgi:hypothetical protein